MTDRYLKLIRVVQTTTFTAPKVAEIFLIYWVAPYGLLTTTPFDNEQQFVFKLFTSLCPTLGVKITITKHHPQTNSQVGKINRTLFSRPRLFMADHQRNWDELVHPMTYACSHQVLRSMGVPSFVLALSNIPRPPIYVEPSSPTPMDTTQTPHPQAFQSLLLE